MTVPAAENFLEIGDWIIERLHEQMPSHVHVLSAADLDGVAEKKQFTPAVHVVLGGFRPTKEAQDGRVVDTEQRWLAVVVVRLTRGSADGEALYKSAGPLVSGVMRALCGFRGLRMIDPPAPAYRSGFMYVPTAWSRSAVVRGDAQ